MIYTNTWDTYNRDYNNGTSRTRDEFTGSTRNRPIWILGESPDGLSYEDSGWYHRTWAGQSEGVPIYVENLDSYDQHNENGRWRTLSRSQGATVNRPIWIRNINWDNPAEVAKWDALWKEDRTMLPPNVPEYTSTEWYRIAEKYRERAIRELDSYHLNKFENIINAYHASYVGGFRWPGVPR